MSHPSSSPNATAKPDVARSLLGDWRFVLAAAVLAATAIGWEVAEDYLGVVLSKSPVFWPTRPVEVEVDSEHRLLSLPTRFADGRYVRAADDTLRDREGEFDEDKLPDGELIYREDVLETLGMGSKYDHSRYPDRRSNWYVSRAYFDKSDRAEHTLWALDITYYTGTLDPVPHVPERCLAAAGARLESVDPITIDGVEAPEGFEDWDGQVRLTRTTYVRQAGENEFGPSKMVQYHVFCYNGRPEADWKQVRLRLLNLFEKYSYFAKIQFAPRATVTRLRRTDEAAAEFFRAVLPDVLRTLPTPATVKKLNEGIEDPAEAEVPAGSAADDGPPPTSETD